jgi:hypothetical protein
MCERPFSHSSANLAGLGAYDDESSLLVDMDMDDLLASWVMGGAN